MAKNDYYGLLAESAEIVGSILSSPGTKSVIRAARTALARDVPARGEAAVRHKKAAAGDIAKVSGELPKTQKRARTAKPNELPEPEWSSVQANQIVLHPAFKMIFLTVAVMTIFAFVAEVVMAGYWTAPTPSQETVMHAADFAWKAGVGAIFGLVGAKLA